MLRECEFFDTCDQVSHLIQSPASLALAFYLMNETSNQQMDYQKIMHLPIK